MNKLTLVLLALALPAAILVPAADAAAQDRAGRAFARVDANHHGKLTPEEFKVFADHVRELAQQRR